MKKFEAEYEKVKDRIDALDKEHQLRFDALNQKCKVLYRQWQLTDEYIRAMKRAKIALDNGSNSFVFNTGVESISDSTNVMRAFITEMEFHNWGCDDYLEIRITIRDPKTIKKGD